MLPAALALPPNFNLTRPSWFWKARTPNEELGLSWPRRGCRWSAAVPQSTQVPIIGQLVITPPTARSLSPTCRENYPSGRQITTAFATAPNTESKAPPH